MTDQTEMTTSQQGTEAATQGGRGLRMAGDNEIALLPAVDIYEDADGITLQADMPGVSRDKLEIQVDQNSLSIEGEISVNVPEDIRGLYADVRGSHFRRTFSLSPELDTEHVSADLRDGVLRLQIAKRAELKPRRIELKSD